MKAFLLFTLLAIITQVTSAQNWLTTGNSGITSSNFLGTTDAGNLIFKANNIERGRLTSSNGIWRFGSASNFAKLDTNGVMSFGGKGSYLVGGNKYAFQLASSPNYGLFFNSTNSLYEFRDGSALPVFSINANTGNGIFNGSLQIGAYTLPGTDGTNGQLLQTNGAGVVSWQTVSGGGGANSALSNLTPTALNRSLLPGSDTLDIGSSTMNFKEIYFSGSIFRGAKKLLSIPGANCVSIGFDNLGINTGIENVALGNGIMQFNTSGFDNTAAGYYALHYNTTGSQNTAFGNNSLFNNTTGNNNSAFGRSALIINSTGNKNAAFGFGALSQNTSGSYNTTYGFNAGARNTTGKSNTFVGNEAGFNNTSGSNNTIVGGSAGRESTSSNNTMLGRRSGTGTTTGTGNTFLGAEAALHNISGSYNTSVGYFSLDDNNTAFGNTALGYSTGTLYTNGNYNTFLGYDADASAPGLTNSSAIGNGSRITANNQVRIGNGAVISIGGFANWTNISDGRIKKDVKENVPGLEFINKLKPVTYHLDITGIISFLKEEKSANKQDEKGELVKQDKALIEKEIKEKEQMLYTGFLAQHVAEVAKEIGYDFSGVDKPQNENSLYGLRYAEFVVPLVKAVQELSKMNDNKDTRINNLQKQNDEQQQQIDELKTMMQTLQQNFNNCTPCGNSNSPQSSVTLSSSLGTGASALEQNIPNPFTHKTTIGYSLPQKFTNAQITITDKTGKILKAVNISGSGKGSLNVDVSILSSGSYQYSLYVDGKLIDTKQMILTK